MSKYEQRVITCLRKLFPYFNIQSQYSLSYLTDAPKSIRHSPLDIYIPELHIGIEVDGEHHRKPVSYGGDVEAGVKFETRKRLDHMKDVALANAGIKLLRINTDILDHIDDVKLSELLSTLITNIIKEQDQDG